MAQPDSPVAIVRADVRGMMLVGARGNYSHWGNYSVDIQNVSDHVVRNVAVRIVVRKTDSSGVGSGMTFTTPLPPGAVATVKGRTGRGEITGPDDTGGPIVYVLIASMDISGCTYEPAKNWPRSLQLDAVGR
jgi:hypothetical protein